MVAKNIGRSALCKVTWYVPSAIVEGILQNYDGGHGANNRGKFVLLLAAKC